MKPQAGAGAGLIINSCPNGISTQLPHRESRLTDGYELRQICGESYKEP